MVTFYRRLPKFDYTKPKSLAEALELLAGNKNGKYKVFAGGTDVIGKLKGRLIEVPEVLVDLKGISGLDYIEWDKESGLRIGALATISSVANSAIVKERFPMLAQGANAIASTQVQNRGTIAGNICNAVPSADSAPALLCLGARILSVIKEGERTIPVEEFFAGPNKTTLRPDEIVKEIQVPVMPERGKGEYTKLSPRSRMDLAVVGVGAMLVSKNGIFEDARISLGAVSPTPIRARKAEAILVGARVDDETIRRAAKSASEECKPIDDHRASAEYRRMMVEVLVRRAIGRCLAK